MTTRRHLPTKRAYIPPEPEDSLVKRARRLPLSGPGIVVTVPLSLLPAYLELQHLEPWTRAEVRTLIQRGGSKPSGVLLVKRQKVEHAHHSG